MQQFIHRIAVAHPFFEGRNSVYLLRCEPLTLIDTGVATPKAYDSLDAGLRTHGVAPADIRRVLLTHKHIDHIGNAWRFQQSGSAEVLIHESETKNVADVDPGGERFSNLVAERLKAWDVPDEIRSRNSDVEMPRWELEACDVTEMPASLPCEFPDGTACELEVIHTPGHTMGSVCFRLGDSLFTGDHVLEKISPNVGAGDLRQRGMLGRFLTSLDRVNKFGDVEVLPGHGEPFRGLADRCDRLAKHHRMRLRQARAAVERGHRTVYDISTQVYGHLKSYHIMLGCAEANAHLEYLVDDGVLMHDGELYVPA